MQTSQGADGRRWAPLLVAGAAGAALALGAFALAESVSTPAKAQSARGVQVTAGQLLINQRISQAAVRRSNEALQLLDPIRPNANQPAKVLGWRTADLRDGSVTTPKLGDAAVTEPKIADGSVGQSKLTAELTQRLPVWALINLGGTVARSTPGATITVTRPATGDYRVDFGRDITVCGYTATIHQSTFTSLAGIGVTVAPGNNNAVRVRINNGGNGAFGDGANRNFMIQLTC